MTDTAPAPARPDVSRIVVALDTADPGGLADFYCRLLGWQVLSTDDDWVTITGEGSTRLAFQLAPDHVPPTWPADDVPQQVHLDLYVPDLDAAEAYALSVGARRVQGPNVAPDFRVFVDPSGHPFCYCSSS